MCISLLLLFTNLFGVVSSVSGFYSYQVSQLNSDLSLYCLSSGQDIKWFRKTKSGPREELRAPDYKVSKSYKCGNPHLCGGYDVFDTKVCLRSTLTLRDLQKNDIGTYFCQEGIQEGGYSYAYILNVLDNISPPHIYDFTPLECNQTLWYGCVATDNAVRYEYFLNDGEKNQKILMPTSGNVSTIRGRTTQYIIRGNYITLQDFTILKMPYVKIGCRAFDSSGSYSEYQTGETVKNLEEPDTRGTYQAHLIKVIGIGAGIVLGMVLIVFVICKLRQRCLRTRRRSDTNVQYSAALSRGENIYTEPGPKTNLSET